MKQQTAVEWLISKQKHNQIFDIETIEQAKEIEKSQIINAYLHKRGKGDLLKCLKVWDSAEDYYNEKYTK